MHLYKKVDLIPDGKVQIFVIMHLEFTQTGGWSIWLCINTRISVVAAVSRTTRTLYAGWSTSN